MTYPDRMQLFRYITGIWHVWYSGAFYREVTQRWQGVGFLYLLLVVAVLMLPITFIGLKELDRALSPSYVPYTQATDTTPALPVWLNELLQEIPTLTIENGKISAERQQVVITPPGAEQPVLRIDTETPVTEVTAQPSVFYVTAYAVHLRFGQELRSIPVAQLLEAMNQPLQQKITLGQEAMAKFAALMVQQAPRNYMLLIIGMWISAFVVSAMRGLVFSFITIMLCQMLRIALPFSTALRISCVATTPILVCEMLSHLLGRPIFGLESLVYFMMHGFFVFRMLEANKRG